MTTEAPFIPRRRELADDVTFDALYPAPIREKSARFWTPVAVAFRAAELLARHHVSRVLDVGSGAGKFCLAAACARPDLHFTGIEQRPHLVEVASRMAAQLGIENVRFLMGDMTSVPWSGFDGFYFYNPFAENVYSGGERLDDTVELSRRRFMLDVRHATAALHAAPVGTCMITFNGLGGPIPASYQPVHAEPARCDWLRVWVKHEQEVEPGTFYVEGRDGVSLVSAATVARNARRPPLV